MLDLDKYSSVLVCFADVGLSPSESANANKRKASEDVFVEGEEVLCPCGAGPSTLLTSTKPQSHGRRFYRCPKTKVLPQLGLTHLLTRPSVYHMNASAQEDGQCGFFQWQDPPAEKARKLDQPSDGAAAYTDNAGANQPLVSNPEALQCNCGLEAVEITSHSAANPDRIFYKCPKTEVSLYTTSSIQVHTSLYTTSSIQVHTSLYTTSSIQGMWPSVSPTPVAPARTLSHACIFCWKLRSLVPEQLLPVISHRAEAGDLLLSVDKASLAGRGKVSLLQMAGSA